ncbi:nuclear transport factor 2 family protein [Novosphingobium chloroacetimidivorans]|nr:nuclear transport factor 2 family protein [Novosphingobium chloroacetimidivorans]
MLAVTAALGATTIAVAQASSLQIEARIAIVQAQVDAFNKGDLDAFASSYAEDVELFDLGPEAKLHLSGRAALIALQASADEVPSKGDNPVAHGGTRFHYRQGAD